MVRFYDGRLGLLLERSDGDGAAPRLLGAGRVGAHFFWAVSPSDVRVGGAAGCGRLRTRPEAFLSPCEGLVLLACEVPPGAFAPLEPLQRFFQSTEHTWAR